MDNPNTDAHELIQEAREALRRGDKEAAHKLGEQAALQDPGLEDAWLILTATDPNPEDALAYAQQALEIDPSSARALKAVEWSIARLHQSQAGAAGEAVPAEPVSPEQVSLEPAPPQETKTSNNRIWIYVAAGIGLLLCLFIVFAAYTGVTRYVAPSFINKVSESPTQESLWAPMNLPKPSSPAATNIAQMQQAVDTLTPASSETALPTQEPATALPTITATAIPTETLSLQSNEPPISSTVVPTEALSAVQTEPAASAPTQALTEAANAAPQVTETPGALSIQVLGDTPTSAYAPPSSSSGQLPAVASSGNGTRWIDVDLTNQRVYAYEGDTVVNAFIVSTGTWLHPTVTGQYNIYVKYRSAPMSGPGYYLPNVPYIMYFYKGYGLHGTYWHNNFGTPMSHGCVNLRTDEAGWLYNWASVGTLVNVHY